MYSHFADEATRGSTDSLGCRSGLGSLLVGPTTATVAWVMQEEEELLTHSAC